MLHVLPLVNTYKYLDIGLSKTPLYIEEEEEDLFLYKMYKQTLKTTWILKHEAINVHDN